MSFGLSHAQLSQGSDWTDKIFIGGNVGATFGTITNVQISPMIGYKVTDKTIVGATLTYIYYKDSRYNPEYKTNIYGGGPFARQYLLDESLDFIDNIFLHAEYEGLNFEVYDGTRTYREWVFSGLVGGGVQSSVLTLTALYNLNHGTNSPYGNSPLIIRVGFGIY